MLRVRSALRLLSAAAVVWALTTIAVSAEPASQTVQVDQPGVKISPTLYGIFFEEINLAGDGGLYAELVRNRSFEDGAKPDHWKLEIGSGAKGEMAVEPRQPATRFNRQALRLKVTEAGGGKVAVTNGGYFGIALVKDALYELSLMARAGEGFAGPLAVSLENTDGTRCFAQAQINGLTAEWKAFSLQLKSNATDPQARLAIAAAQPGTVWLDMV